jgi:hypothetical protein
MHAITDWKPMARVAYTIGGIHRSGQLLSRSRRKRSETLKEIRLSRGGKFYPAL